MGLREKARQHPGAQPPLPLVRHLLPRQQPQESRLPGPVGAEDRHPVVKPDLSAERAGVTRQYQVLADDGALAGPPAAQPHLDVLLSKLYWGGLRTGWISASAGLIARLGAAKAAADLGSAAFPQAVTAALLSDKHDDIVKWRGEWLRARYDAMTGALRAALPEWTWPEPDGGLTLWVRLPRLAAPGPADSGAFAQAALRHGVAVVPGRLLSATAGGVSGSGSQAGEYLRLAFTQPPDVLARSAVALAAASGGRGPSRAAR